MAGAAHLHAAPGPLRVASATSRPLDAWPWARTSVLAAILVALGLAAPRGTPSPHPSDATLSRCELDPPREAPALEACLALLPRDVELMLDLGALYEAGGQVDKAEALYRQAIAIDPKDGDVRVRLARVRLTRGDLASATREAEVSLRLQPNNARARALLERTRPRETP